MKKLGNTGIELKKSVAYIKKACTITRVLTHETPKLQSKSFDWFLYNDIFGV